MRFHQWLPASDPRVRCPAGHVFKPHAQLQRGSVVIGCAQCHARLVVVMTRAADMKLVAEVRETDLTPMTGLSAAGVLVYLLTTPLDPHTEQRLA